MYTLGFPGGASGKEPACQCRRWKRHEFDPWVQKIPWRWAWQSIPVFLPGESHGQRNLAGYGPFQFSSVTQLCLTLCDPMDYSTPGLPVQHQLPEFTQTHVHWIGNAIQPSSSVIPFSSHLQSFPVSGSLQMSQFFATGGQSIGISVSASVLPMNIQGWFPLGWIGWISLLSKVFSRVFSNSTVQKHQFFGA